MTDPEITDPRDPMRRPDIVAEIDRWLALPASLREATVSHALLQAARDEIVALRAQLEAFAPLRIAIADALAAARRETRVEALEDCIRICPECANRIKALNTVGADHLRAEREKRDD